MFGLSESTVYYMCQHPVDMRKGINGLYKLVRSKMKMSPLTGSVFIFYGKNHQSVKLLRWDTDGFVLYQKRAQPIKSVVMYATGDSVVAGLVPATSRRCCGRVSNCEISVSASAFF